MQIRKSNVTASFFIYNEKYFNGVLPMPKIVITHSKNILGRFTCYLTNDGDHYDEVLEVSDNYDYTNEQFRNIVVHEMIHYYLVHTRKDMKCSHGKEFQRLAKLFNTAYGMDIMSYATLDAYQPLKKPKRNVLYKLKDMFS